LIYHHNRELVSVGNKWEYMASLPGPAGNQWLQWSMPPLDFYSGSGEPRMQLSTEGGIKGSIPGFSVYNKDKRFIDLYINLQTFRSINIDKARDENFWLMI